MAQRIQRRRTKGWRLPAGAVVVSRPSRWGNPYRVERGPVGWRVVGNGSVSWPEQGQWTRAEAQAFAVQAFRDYVLPQPDWASNYVIAARIELAGRDLACWCPLPAPGEPDLCHGAVLLEAANG